MGVWDPRYTRDYQLATFPGNTLVEVVDSKTKVKIVHITDVKYVLPADRVIWKFHDYQSFGRQSKLRIDPKDILNLKWEPTLTVHIIFLAVSSKIDSATSSTDSLNPLPVMSTTS